MREQRPVPWSLDSTGTDLYSTLKLEAKTHHYLKLIEGKIKVCYFKVSPFIPAPLLYKCVLQLS